MKQKDPIVLGKDSEIKFPHILLISASAGSGKTYTLAKRYVQFVLSDKIPLNKLENILAVTFTNNAAKEMKVRILDWLKELALDPRSPKIRETAALVDMSEKEIRSKAAKITDEILSDYSNFHIQTIDSFLARIMSCSTAELNLPFRPEITMNYDALQEAALYLLFSRIGTEEFKTEEIDEFLEVIPKSSAFPWNPITRVRKNFSGFMNEEGRTGGEIFLKKGLNPSREIKRKFRKIMEFCSEIENKAGNPDLLRNFYFRVKESGNITLFISKYRSQYGIIKGNIKAARYDGWEEDKFKLNAMVLDLAEFNSRYHYYPYISIYRKFLQELDKIKNGKSETLHISDIARRLSSYIKRENVPEIYLKLGEKINHFLIDEFQDTNKLQWDVMRPLIEEALSKRGSLFAVGDIKQAIYMFRNADYKIMRNFLDVAAGKGKSEYLSLDSLGGKIEKKDLPVNYRSDGEIVSFADYLFKDRIKRMGEIIGDDRTELTSFKQRPLERRKDKGKVETIVMEAKSMDDGVEKDIFLSEIKKACEKYPLNEIAVLTDKNKRISSIVEWLSGEGINVASLSSLDIRKRKIIAEILGFMRFLETPADNLSFSSFILGDIFIKASGFSRGKTEEFILSLRKTDMSYVRFKEKFPETWEKFFDEIFSKVGYLPLYELATLVYSVFSLFENFPDEAAFLSKFLDACAKSENSGVATLSGFLDSVLKEDDETEKFFSVDLPEFLDAVRVMTFHKSKGLGFSAVFNMIYDERGPKENMFFKETGGGALEVWYIIKDLADFSDKLAAVYRGKKESERIQNLNLLYVISTRAKHQMTNIVVKQARKKPREEMKPIDAFENIKKTGKVEMRKKILEKAPPALSGASPKPKEMTGGKVKPTSESGREAARGNLVHEILSEITSESDFSAVDEICERKIMLYPFGFDKKEISGIIARFLKSPQAEDLFSQKPGREVMTEKEFTDSAGNLKRMDRVIIDPDCVAVVDFKTGGEDEDYAGQIAEYKKILKEVYKKPVKGYIAYVDLSKVAEV